MLFTIVTMETIVNLKTIKARKEVLSTFLRENDTGELNGKDSEAFRILFATYYTPDESDIKFSTTEIASVKIDIHKTYGTSGFQILVNDEWQHASIERLAGGKRTEHANLNRALRDAILPQIRCFRENNPLDHNATCPVTSESIGYDAEVDHEIPFHRLVSEWLKTQAHIKCEYDSCSRVYKVDTSLCESWCEFHRINARLRWLSKKGNQIAHLQKS